MKLLFQLLMMVLLALLVLLFIYPALHEAGHVLTAVICGAEVVGAEVFPTAYTTITTEQCGKTELILIMMSGGAIPLMVLFSFASAL